MAMGLRPLHARYPYFHNAREAVREADIELAAAARDPAIARRATERVESALSDRMIGEPDRNARIELLSYPVARVLVSLVNQPVVIHRYARAEAVAARERFEADLETTALRSTRNERLTIGDLLAEFDLDGHVRETDREYEIRIATYLSLASDLRDEKWRLVNRNLADGQVRADREEVLGLLGEAVRKRVADGLPFGVPELVGDVLEDEKVHVLERLAETNLIREIDTVVPELFPPCMKYLLDRIQKGEHLDHHSRFAITAFLTNIGMSTDDIVELYSINPGFGEEITRYQTDHIRGEISPTEYSTPACATMQSYGDCVNMDDRCERISHPMAYYEDALDDADEEALTDWRARESEAEEADG